MARFVYRLQKVFELRERKKKEHEQRVIDAQKRVRDVEIAIEEKKNEIRMVRKNMLASPHTLMAAHDEFIHHLNDRLEELYEDLSRAKAALAYERELLIKAQADLEALVKHKEKAREEWLEEEKKLELKMLDEIAGQRYFRAKLQEELDNAEYEQLKQEEFEGY
ncbi:MAG: Flagellar FliJ protein [Vampirovibrio sp.]|jgi:flagellar export protein FliJ|nr:Flagellar FliJ protein [Vampirovibrio sp.]